jgi:Uma2 family endonuclease
MAAHVLPTLPGLPALRIVTRAEYHRMIDLGFFRPEERAELVYGRVLSTTPPKPPHANAVSNLGGLLTVKLWGRAKVRVQQPVVADGDSEPEPDVAVVPLDDYSTRHPDRAYLLVEVAKSSLQYDRETKAPLYAASGVPEYWIVDVEERAVEIYTEPQNGRYARMHRVTSPDERLPFGAFPDVEVRVRDVLGG